MTGTTPAIVLPSVAGSSGAVVRLRPRTGSRGGQVLSWKDAHRVAAVAAAQAHAQLDVDPTSPRVDVQRAIRAAGIALMWQPMPRLFGAFVNEDGGSPGILVNSGLPRGARRHTAAHELGHAWLRHSTSVDDGSTIDTVVGEEIDAIPHADRRRPWPDQEKTAEAFAAWFLMPRRVVHSALKIVGSDRPRSAEDVYRLSLLLGTSYRSTLRHLPNLRLANARDCNAWARTAPATLKNRLDLGAEPPASRRYDVWRIDEAYNGAQIEVEAGDRVVIAGAQPDQLQFPTWMTIVPSPSAGSAVVLDVSAESDARTGIIDDLASPGWSVRVIRSPAPRGLDPRSVP